MDAALASSEAAFKSWREVPVQSRARTIMKFAEAIRANLERVAEVITREQGKTLADSRGDVIRGLEVVEHAGAFPSLMLGETAPALAANIDTFTLRQPLGVTAGICPFNFPASACSGTPARFGHGRGCGVSRSAPESLTRCPDRRTLSSRRQ